MWKKWSEKNFFSNFYFFQFSFKTVLNDSGRYVERRDRKIVVLGMEDGEFVSVSEPVFGLQISSVVKARARHPDAAHHGRIDVAAESSRVTSLG